jgi:hypothetical protein
MATFPSHPILAMAASATQDTSTQTSIHTPTPEPLLTLSKCIIRRYHPSDAEAAARAANNPNVARYMTNGFPHP